MGAPMEDPVVQAVERLQADKGGWAVDHLEQELTDIAKANGQNYHRVIEAARGVKGATQLLLAANDLDAKVKASMEF